MSGRATAIERDARTSCFDAPERGSADELLDAGAHGDRSTPMRHSAAHVMAEAVLDLFPGTQARHRAGDRRRLLLRLPAAAAADARTTSRRSRSGWRRVDRRRPPVRPRGALAGGGAGASSSSATSRSRSRSSTTSPRRRRRDGTPMPPTTVYEHGPFIDLCKGPHVASTGQDRPVQAARRRRRVLARRREAADAPARSTARSGRRRRSSTPTCGGARRRRSATTAGSASQLDLFSFHDVSPGSAFWHPKGQRIWRTLEGAMRELQARRGYQEVSHADPRERAALAAVRATGTSTRDNMFILESEEPALQPQADELPGVDVHLPLASCARTATCRCASTSTAGSIATSARARCRA